MKVEGNRETITQISIQIKPLKLNKTTIKK